MADTDLAATGKDTTVALSYDGATIAVYEVTRERATPAFDEVVTKPLGKTTRNIDEVVTGWELTLEVDVTRKDLDELMDLIIAASRARVPGLLAVTVKTKYRDLTSKTYTYLDCKVSAYNAGGARGEARKSSLTVKSGMDRIAS